MTGNTRTPDGGIDVLAGPKEDQIPYVVGVQVKHHKRFRRKTGVDAVRSVVNAINREPIQIGLVVTNTQFTSNAVWEASRSKKMIQLKDFEDLVRWLSNDFTISPAGRKQLPASIRLTKGLEIQLPWGKKNAQAT